MPNPLKPGLHEAILTRWLQRELERQSTLIPVLESIESREARTYLTRLIARELETALRALQNEDEGSALLNELVEHMMRSKPGAPSEEGVVEPLQILRGLMPQGLGAKLPPPPVVPLTQSALLVNDDQRISMGAALKRELASADRVDLICAFVGHSGVRILEEEILSLKQRGGRLRLITTTYLGATQRKALDLLHRWGAEIKVVYELPPSNTKLHAKAWIFHRDTGYTTATIGSSNLSHTALVDGLEWNVRLSATDAPQVLEQFQSTFERYWASPEFEDYEPGRDGERLQKALSAASSPANDEDRIRYFLDLKPWPHQVEILDALQVERERHRKWRNLVVAATGTGKTVVAALDYKRLRKHFGDPSLLFVAHRKEILGQARSAYRHVLRDGSFGEMWVDGARPEGWRHVFASIQSISALRDLSTIAPDRFDVVVIDEFHHAEAATYRRLLEHIQPKCLLGLTATPERADGKDVAEWFGGSTIEIRLWDALDRGLLCPFQYFGVSDDTDLSDLTWERGYLAHELDERYVTNGHARARIVAEQTRKIVTDVSTMRALAFCASVNHARFMAERFNELGIRSEYLSAETPSERREAVRLDLQAGKIRCIFAVDLFNEGVDLPEVDTVLFLRPTESATVFIQQIGRGLRLCEGKSCLTVLDFIGQQHRRFRFDLRFRAMTGYGRSTLAKQIEGGFPALPAGCHIQLDRQSRHSVLENLKAQIPSNTRRMAEELKDLTRANRSLTVGEFLRETQLDAADLYRSNRTFTGLKRRIGLLPKAPEPLEEEISSRVKALLNVGDRERASRWTEWLRSQTPPEFDRMGERERRLVYMLGTVLLGGVRYSGLGKASRLWEMTSLRRELADLIGFLDDSADRLTRPLLLPRLEAVPLHLHADYSKDEVMAAFGLENPSSMREGVKWFERERTDALLVTLRKSEALFSPTTRYDDRFVSPTELHWESQSTTTEDSPTGMRYQSHDRSGSHVLMFVREQKSVDGRTSPFTFLGPAHYVRHESERPMRVTWRLDHPVPEALYLPWKTAAG